MLALQAYEDARCGGCGGFLPDTTDQSADEGYRVPDPTRCHRCTAISQKAESYRDARQPQALLFHAERRR